MSRQCILATFPAVRPALIATSSCGSINDSSLIHELVFTATNSVPSRVIMIGSVTAEICAPTTAVLRRRHEAREHIRHLLGLLRRTLHALPLTRCLSRVAARQHARVHLPPL